MTNDEIKSELQRINDLAVKTSGPNQSEQLQLQLLQSGLLLLGNVLQNLNDIASSLRTISEGNSG